MDTEFHPRHGQIHCTRKSLYFDFYQIRRLLMKYNYFSIHRPICLCSYAHTYTKCTTLSATDFRIVLFCAVCFHHDDIACKTIIIIVMNYNNGLLKYFSFYSTATKIQEVFIVPQAK